MGYVVELTRKLTEGEKVERARGPIKPEYAELIEALRTIRKFDLSEVIEDPDEQEERTIDELEDAIDVLAPEAPDFVYVYTTSLPYSTRIVYDKLGVAPRELKDLTGSEVVEFLQDSVDKLTTQLASFLVEIDAELVSRVAECHKEMLGEISDYSDEQISRLQLIF